MYHVLKNIRNGMVLFCCLATGNVILKKYLENIFALKILKHHLFINNLIGHCLFYGIFCFGISLSIFFMLYMKYIGNYAIDIMLTFFIFTIGGGIMGSISYILMKIKKNVMAYIWFSIALWRF
jgi:hypothetical protein